jgi:hypothetical protein
MRKVIAAAMLPVIAGGCVTDRQTDTPRTATEELLVSDAADRAVQAVMTSMPRDNKVFLDTTNFDATDGKYAIAAIREALLRRDNSLVDKKSDAASVVEVRSGALATNDHELLIGIPSFSVPVPLAGPITTPKLALYDKATQLGVAKIAVVATNAKTGALIGASAPQYGYAHSSKHIVLLVFGWSSNDLIPQERRDPDFK